MVARVKVVFDSNILIDYLRGHKEAKREIDRYEEAQISIVTWMEVLCGAKDENDNRAVRSFLARFTLQPLSEPIAERAVTLRKEHRIRLPDAIIWATARTTGSLLVTRNTRDFSEEEPDIRIPYQLP
jgi:predicted nucleic acid-binding protein